MMILKKSPVDYNREAHTYTLNGVRLSGVTEMIKYQLQPDSYSGVSPEVLAKAAKKGSMVHDLCETYDNFDSIPTEDDILAYRNSLVERGKDNVDEEVDIFSNAVGSCNIYRRLKEGKGLDYLASEYIVSDNKDFASPIDKVYYVDEHTVDIADIKTISTLDKAALEKVSWQCSIYAKWFEEQNPDIKVRNLFVIWLPDKKYWTKTKQPSIKKIARIPDEEVDKLLSAEISDGKYRENSVPRSARSQAHALVKADATLPAEITALTTYVTDTLKAYKEAEAVKKDMTEKVREAMEHFNIKSWTTDSFSFYFSADSETKTFDIDAFRADYPDINIEKYYKVKTRKGGFTAKAK